MCPSATSEEEGGLDSLADLMLDLSSVIVERSGLLPGRGVARPRAWTPRRHTRARPGSVSWPLIGPPGLNTDLMVQTLLTCLVLTFISIIIIVVILHSAPVLVTPRCETWTHSSWSSPSSPSEPMWTP